MPLKTMSSTGSPSQVASDVSQNNQDSTITTDVTSISITNDHVQPDLSLPLSILQKFPKLVLTPYSFCNERDPANVLSLVHNAAKRELVDLLTIVIPALTCISRITLSSSLFQNPTSSSDSILHPDLQRLRIWWDSLLRFLFFVADTDDDISRIVSAPAIDLAKRRSEVKVAASLEKNRKSLSDRYSFAMEYVFRAADRALQEFCSNPEQIALDQFSEKSATLTNFMLDSMAQAVSVVANVTELVDVSLTNLEYKVANSLSSFQSDRKTLYLFICARWMGDSELIKRWILKFGGLKARVFYESWKSSFDEQRTSFVSHLSTQYAAL